jgi:hypothetical protein
MEHADHLITAAAAAQGQGTPHLLQIVIVVSVLGAGLLAWFLLRGYKRDE